MHCPSCGTANVPDSRFCGICGAKLAPTAESRVAPTAKIPDDAAFAPRHFGAPPDNYVSSPAPPSIPPNSGYYAQPASIPPNTYIAPPYATGPATLPPGNHTSAAAAPRYPREPSVSMQSAASPRWGLIILLLVVDLGLAGAGAFMLQKGLARTDASVEKPRPPPASAAAAAPPAPAPAPGRDAAPQPGLAASVNAIAQTAPIEPAPPSPPKTVAVARAKASHGPYDAIAALPGEIELAAARVKGDFASCQAQETGEVHGRIDISFTIERDGAVTRVTSLADTTGSRTLAPCLSSVIRTWAFASHPASPINFVRPFLYN